MNVTSDILKGLKTPFQDSQISWRAGYERQGHAQALPYIDNRDVQTRLDEVVGVENWKNEFFEVVANGKLLAVRCVISILVEGQWISKSDAAPLGVATDRSPTDLLLKGVYSDAMKRAAVHWGIGRYLYAFEAPWVPVDGNNNLLTIPVLPAEFLPEGATPRSAPTTQEPQSSTEPADESGGSADKGLSEDKAASDALSEPIPSSSADEQALVEPDSLCPLAQDVLNKIGKLAPSQLRSYVQGPKGQEKLSAVERTFLLAKIALAEAATEANKTAVAA